MRSLIVSLLIVALAFGTTFDEFIVKYNRNYKNQAEYTYRRSVFQTSIARAARLQAENKGSATFGVNEFSDLTQDEFRATHLLPLNYYKEHSDNKTKVYATEPIPSAVGSSCSPNPTTYDWNTCGCILGVRNQGQCGDCWAFSTAETVESYCILAGGASEPLSTQQMVDCDTTDSGCNGGLPSNAYQYIQSAGGLDTEAQYPYTAEQGTCQVNNGDFVCTTTGWTNINGETGLYTQTSSSNGGPVSVLVDASTWQDYTGGVITTCGSNIDHAVQLTGYSGYGGEGAYWIVRNSWGTTWGENGYIWVAIGSNLCEIGSAGTIPYVQVVGGSTGSTNSASSGSSTGSSTGESSTGSQGTSGTSDQGTSGTSSTGNAAEGYYNEETVVPITTKSASSMVPVSVGGAVFVVVMVVILTVIQLRRTGNNAERSQI